MHKTQRNDRPKPIGLIHLTLGLVLTLASTLLISASSISTAAPLAQATEVATEEPSTSGSPAPASPTLPNRTATSVVPSITSLALGITFTIGTNGLVVLSVTPGGAGAQVGLRPNDVIIEVDRVRFTPNNPLLLANRIVSFRPLQMVVLRNDAQVPLQFPTPTLFPSRTPTIPPVAPGQPGQVSRILLGVVYDSVTPALAKARNLSVDYGALVVSVTANSPAQIAGIRPNDIITYVEEDKVDSKRTLGHRLMPYVTGDTVVLTVMRGAETLKIEVVFTTRSVARVGADAIN
jgi:S1-C subfamily serine protease